MGACPRTRLGPIDLPSKMRAKSKPPGDFVISPDILKGCERGKRFCTEYCFIGKESGKYSGWRRWYPASRRRERRRVKSGWRGGPGGRRSTIAVLRTTLA